MICRFFVIAVFLFAFFACNEEKGLQRQSLDLDTGNASTVDTVNVSYLASAAVDIQDVNDNGLITLTSNRLDNGWSIAASEWTYTGAPDRVRIDAMIRNIEGAVAVARANPSVILQKFDGVNWNEIAQSASGYIRDATGHGESSNTVSYIDQSPGVNPQYRLFSRQESADGDPTNSSATSNMTLEAVERIVVYVP